MIEEINLEQTTPFDAPEPLPFPFNQRTYCRYQPIEKRIEEARVLVIDDLLRNEDDISEVARREWGRHINTELQRERKIAGMAIENILNNIERLVKRTTTRVAHLSEIGEAAGEFRPDAIVLSGTLRDFDFYNPAHLENFGRFVRATKTPVLGICGGHQLVGLSFGARILTLDNMEQHERREGRPLEYQYRFIRITDPNDPVFCGINDANTGLWQDYTTEARILRVWQNHGLQLDRVPEGFHLLATAYLCRNQMMVKRNEGQLIYTVQFHLEKSFEDWNKNRTRWEHQNESRDGRIIFENFLLESLNHQGEAGVECETAQE
jgi:GMP synthase (glutamine-hydrolysing)